MASAPNWAEQLTGIGTALGALGLLGAILAAVYAGRQVREARISREAQTAVEFFRRWNEDALVEARRLLASFETSGELKSAFERYVAEGADEAYVLYRELDYFEQMAAMEKRGALDLELIQLLLGRIMVERWELWQPAIVAAHGSNVYPLFEELAGKMRSALAGA